MEIKNVASVPLTGISNRPEAKGNNSASAVADGAQTAVTHASKSAKLKTIQKMAGAAAPFDASKVSAIKSAVDAGSFKVNAGIVADGLIASTKDMLSGVLGKPQNAATGA